MHVANQADPLTRQPEAGIDTGGMSPMDPPEAYAPPGLDRVKLDELHPFLRRLCEEHALLAEELSVVEEAVVSMQEAGFTSQVEGALLGFCRAIERDFIPHSRQEETVLFPLLHERLIADGEHSKGRAPTTAVDIMQDDHVKVIQLAAVIANFLRLASHLPDESSTLVVRDAALRHVGSLVELLRLHMFREDNIVFSSAHRLLSAEDLDRMQSEVRLAT